MAKYAVNKAGRILHPTLVTGYLRERSGVWYCSYRNVLRSTGIRAGKDTAQAAMEFLERFAAGYDRPETATGKRLSDVLPEYIAQRKRGVSPARINRLIEFFRLYFPVDHLIADAAAFRADIIKRGAGYSSGYYIKHIQVFSKFFRWCVAAGQKPVFAPLIFQTLAAICLSKVVPARSCLRRRI